MLGMIQKSTMGYIACDPLQILSQQPEQVPTAVSNPDTEVLRALPTGFLGVSKGSSLTSSPQFLLRDKTKIKKQKSKKL